MSDNISKRRVSDQVDDAIRIVISLGGFALGSYYVYSLWNYLPTREEVEKKVVNLVKATNRLVNIPNIFIPYFDRVPTEINLGINILTWMATIGKTITMNKGNQPPLRKYMYYIVMLTGVVSIVNVIRDFIDVAVGTHPYTHGLLSFIAVDKLMTFLHTNKRPWEVSTNVYGVSLTMDKLVVILSIEHLISFITYMWDILVVTVGLPNLRTGFWQDIKTNYTQGHIGSRSIPIFTSEEDQIYDKLFDVIYNVALITRDYNATIFTLTRLIMKSANNSTIDEYFNGEANSYDIDEIDGFKTRLSLKGDTITVRIGYPIYDVYHTLVNSDDENNSDSVIALAVVLDAVIANLPIPSNNLAAEIPKNTERIFRL